MSACRLVRPLRAGEDVDEALRTTRQETIIGTDPGYDGIAIPVRSYFTVSRPKFYATVSFGD